MSKQEEIIEVCGKKVVVRYTKDGAPCEKCVLNGIRGCGTSKCSRLDKVGMEIDERAYFVEAPQEEETHSLREWAQILVKNPDLRAEFDKLCPPQPIQGSIAPEADLEAEIKRYMETHLGRKGYWDRVDTARHFAEWGAEHLKK